MPQAAKWTSALRTGVGSANAPRNRGAFWPGANGTVTTRSPSWRSFMPVVACASCAMPGLGTCTSTR